MTMPSGIPVSTYYYESVDDYNAIAGTATSDMTRAYKEHYGFAAGVGFVTSYISDTDNRPTPIMKVQINLAATDSDSTAPTLSFTSSSGLTNLVLTASEPIATDTVGTTAAGTDIKDLFTIDNGSITSATVGADGVTITFVIDASGAGAGDVVAIEADSLYDGAGNVMVADDIADINAGETAWEAAP
jgi:hypothetical protein